MNNNTFQLIVNTKGCARCGNDHDELVFEPLDNHETYSHFAMCPLLNQPILLYFRYLANQHCCTSDPPND